MEESTFLLTLGHVVTAPSNEAVGQRAVVFKKHPVGAVQLITRLLNKNTRQTNIDISP